MLINVSQFGGLMPRIIDPTLLPEGKSQVAKNCRFDRGGVTALEENQLIQELTFKPASIYRNIDGKFFLFSNDTDVVTAPLANDTYGRVYFTENGELRVTDQSLYKSGSGPFPQKSYNPSPLPPASAPIITPFPSKEAVTKLTITDSNCGESNGTYSLIFAGGGGTGAIGTYTVLNGVITDTILTSGGSYVENPTVSTQSGTGSIMASGINDPTLMETRGYIYTLVNGYGSEGPPSPVSALVDVWDGDKVILSGMDTTAGSDYNIKTKRIYRINQSSTGAEYQFLAEIDIAAADYTDTTLDADLGEVLGSAEWDGAPTGIQGLIALPDGSLAGFFGSTLCRSVPYYPHAWPVSYQMPVDKPIVALGAFGTTIVVLTSGKPKLAVGNDPSNVVMEDMDIGFASMSKRGTVQAGDTVIYPSPEGVVAISPSFRAVLTEEIMTREDWLRIYNPESISAFYWEGHYVGFYTNSNGQSAGFIFNIAKKELSDLTFYASAGYRDPGTGILYLAV